MWWFVEFCDGVSNLKKFWRVIWNDRDWDHAYFERIMLTKFEKWYDRYSKIEDLPFPHEGIEKHIQAMRICINILRRRKEDWYTQVWYNNKLQQKVKYNFESVIIHGEQMYEMKHFGLTEEEELENSKLLKNSGLAEKRDWRIFCRILEKYNEYWWD